MENISLRGNLYSCFATFTNQFRRASRLINYIIINEKWKTAESVNGANFKPYSTFEQYVEKELNVSIEVLKVICFDSKETQLLIDCVTKNSKYRFATNYEKYVTYKSYCSVFAINYNCWSWSGNEFHSFSEEFEGTIINKVNKKGKIDCSRIETDGYYFNQTEDIFKRGGLVFFKVDE